KPVENCTREELRPEENDGERHEVHHGVHHLLLRIGDLLVGRPHHAGLNKLEDTREYRQDEGRVWLGEVWQPQEAICPVTGATFTQRINGAIDTEEDGELNQHWQTTGHRVDAVLLVERHLRLRGGLAIFAVLFLDFL